MDLQEVTARGVTCMWTMGGVGGVGVGVPLQGGGGSPRAYVSLPQCLSCLSLSLSPPQPALLICLVGGPVPRPVLSGRMRLKTGQ